MKILLLLSFCLGVLTISKLRYDDCKVHRVIPETKEQLEALENLEKSDNALRF